MGTWLFSDLKWLACGFNDPPLATPEVKDRAISVLPLCVVVGRFMVNFAFTNTKLIETLDFAEMLALNFVTRDITLSSSNFVCLFC
jgi:hypothetical protein